MTSSNFHRDENLYPLKTILTNFLSDLDHVRMCVAAADVVLVERQHQGMLDY